MIRINGELIVKTTIEAEADRLRPHYQKVFTDQSPEEQEKQLFDWARENVIERVLLAQTARKKGYAIQPEQVNKAFEDLKQQHGGDNSFYSKFNLSQDNDPEIKADLGSQLMVEQLIEDICKDLKKPAEQEVLEYYHANQGKYLAPEQVHAAHIVKYINTAKNPFEARKEISDIDEKLKSGASFEELAVKYSDCPDQAGDLGYFSRGHMVQDFEDIVFNMELNQVSDIFRTEFGYHIAKLYDRRPPEPIPFANVKDEIGEHLINEKKQKWVEDYIDRLKEKAVIVDE